MDAGLVSSRLASSPIQGDRVIGDILDDLVEDVERLVAVENLERAISAYEAKRAQVAAVFGAVHRPEPRVDVVDVGCVRTHTRAEQSFAAVARGDGGLDVAALNSVENAAAAMKQEEVNATMAFRRERTTTSEINALYRSKRIERHEELARLREEAATLSARVQGLETRLGSPRIGAVDVQGGQVVDKSTGNEPGRVDGRGSNKKSKRVWIGTALLIATAVVGGIFLKRRS